MPLHTAIDLYRVSNQNASIDEEKVNAKSIGGAYAPRNTSDDLLSEKEEWSRFQSRAHAGPYCKVVRLPPAFHRRQTSR